MGGVGGGGGGGRKRRRGERGRRQDAPKRATLPSTGEHDGLGKKKERNRGRADQGEKGELREGGDVEKIKKKLDQEHIGEEGEGR